jgi:hypothetical protein
MCVFRHATISPIQTLIEIASIAIWDRNKVIMAAAISVWVINVGVLTQGMFLLSSPGEDLEFNINIAW